VTFVEGVAAKGESQPASASAPTTAAADLVSRTHAMPSDGSAARAAENRAAALERELVDARRSFESQLHAARAAVAGQGI
jgi:hypothetical protein